MAETEVIETEQEDGDKSPLAAFRKFKQGSPPVNPAVQNSGTVNPFGDLAVKKKEVSQAAVSNGSPSLSSGAQVSQSSPQHSNVLSAINEASAQHNQQMAQLTPEQNFIAKQYDPKYQLENESSPYYQEKARLEAERAKNGSWKNTLPQFEHALVGLFTKPLAGAAHLSVDIAKGLGDTKTDQSFTQKLATGLDAYNNETAKEDYNNPLPDTFLGNTTNAALHLAPIVGLAKFLPEGSAGAEAASVDLAALQRLKSIAINPFTKISAIQGGLEGYDQARQEGKSPMQAAKSGAKGFIQGGASAATMNILGSVAGDALSPALAKGLVKTGILQDGKLTKMGADAVSDAAVFGAYPVVSHLITDGKLPDRKEIEENVGIGLLFGGMKAAKTHIEFSEADKEIQQNRQGLAMKNFIEADPDAIQQAYKLPQSAADINAQAVDYAAKARSETDLDKRKEYIAASSTYTKAANVKSVAQAIVAHPEAFITEVENSPDLTQEQRTLLIDKIKQTHAALDPLEQQKTQLGGQISSIDADLTHLQPIAASETDPVKRTEAEVAIENLTKAKEEAYKKLKKVVVQQHDEHQEGTPFNETEPAILKKADGTIVRKSDFDNIPQSERNMEGYKKHLGLDYWDAGEAQDNWVKLNNKEEPTNAVSEQTTGEVGVREQDAVGEGVGEQDKPSITSTESGRSEVEKSVEPEQAAAEVKQKAIDAVTHGIVVPENIMGRDPSARFDFGMTTAEKQKAVRDIKAGNYETAPAKKMLSKLQEWDANDAYPIIEGLGGKSVRHKSATAEEIQQNIDDAKAHKIGELSTRQIEEINKPLSELGFTHQDFIDYENHRTESERSNARTAESTPNDVQRAEDDTPTSPSQDTGSAATQGEPEPSPLKGKIIDRELIQPSKLGEDYHLVLAQKPNGNFAIVDAKSGRQFSNDYEDEYSARVSYSKNRNKITLEKVEAQLKKVGATDDTPQKKVAAIADAKRVDKDIKNTGVTFDQIKEYERARATRLPASDGEQPESISPDIQQQRDDKGAGEDENTQREAIRPQSEIEQSADAKDAVSGKLKAKLDDAKADLSAAIKKQRGKLSVGVDPELLKSMAKVIKAYADIGIHKFGEIVRDWVKTYKDTTDEDVDALKGAYAAHVANLTPKERGQYNTLKELDAYMKDRAKPAKDIPVHTPRSEPRLPIPAEDDAPDAPKLRQEYSKLSKLKSYGIRNLEQLKAFSKDIKDFNPLREVRKYATSKSQASVILKTATQGIIKLVGKDGWQRMREVLVESRLRGIRSRWNKYADQMEQMPDEQVKTIFDDGEDGNMYDLVKNLQPIAGEGNPGKFAVSLIGSGRYGDAKTYLSNLYRKAADNVLTLGIPFDEMVKDGKFTDPKMQEALDVYKSLLERPIAESHASNEGIFSDDLGDLDTYYPLIGENANKPRLIAKGKPFNEPGNINNKFATGQSDRYSTEIAALSDKLTAAIKTNNKATALDALKQAGLITDVAHNAPETSQMQVGNDVYDFVKEKVAEGRTIINPDGQIINTPSKYVMMPKWLKSELDPIFNSTDQFDKYNAFGKVMNVLTKVALGGPTEAVAHSYRMLGVLTNSMPFMQEWAYKNGVVGDAGGYVANNPFVKKWTGLFKILNTDISSDKALQTIQEMSKLGIIPEKTWTKTWSREFAELTGAKASRIKMGKLDIPNFTDFSPILYGKKSIDLKARVLMYNLTKAMNPDATPEQHVKMQNELGVYTKALQGQMERGIKESGFAPYYTFGSSVYRTALKSVLGLNPLPVEGGSFVKHKAAQLITNGIIGSVASWMLVYHAQTGKWPWEDESSKLGRIPFPEWAKNDLTKDFFTDAKGDWKDINMMAINNPIVERGMRVLGAEKAYETNQLGGTPGQSFESGGTQALNTLVSPFTSSPALQFASTAVTGSAPYVTGLRDDRGKPSPQLYKKVKAVESGSQPFANIYGAFKAVNPLIDVAINKSNKYTGLEKSLFGLNSVTNPDTQNEGASPLGFVLNMAFPRFFVPHGSDEGKATAIEKGQKSLEKTIEKEQQKEDE